MSDHHHHHTYEYQNHYQIVSDQHHCTFDYYYHIYQNMPDHHDHTFQIIMIILLIIISLIMTTLCDHDDEFDDKDQRLHDNDKFDHKDLTPQNTIILSPFVELVLNFRSTDSPFFLICYPSYESVSSHNSVVLVLYFYLFFIWR